MRKNINHLVRRLREQSRAFSDMEINIIIMLLTSLEELRSKKNTPSRKNLNE